MTHKRNRRRSQRDTPEALAAGLPAELRSFDRWLYNSGDRVGLRDYFVALGRHLANTTSGPVDGMEVINAAGLSAADWFRHMMTEGHKL